jgi:hypothetical protein
MLSPVSLRADLVTRAETTELRSSDGKLFHRVERDSAGNVTGLHLNDMKLSPKDVAELGTLSELRRIVLFRTNFRNEDMAKLSDCKKIESLNLTSTQVTDDAIDAVTKFTNLKYLCLGDVDVSPEAIAKLKATFDARAQVVKMGYSRRK